VNLSCLRQKIQPPHKTLLLLYPALFLIHRKNALYLQERWKEKEEKKEGASDEVMALT
jgi:hypothetical protein